MDHRSDGERVGGAVLALRTGRGEEQQALARRAGVTPAWLSKLERGQIDNPGHATVDAVAQALGFRDGNDLLRMFYGHDRYRKERPRTRGRGRPRLVQRPPPPDDPPPEGGGRKRKRGCRRRLRPAG